MRLKKLTIRNFKGITSFEEEFGDETKILGANGTGKTSVFDAYLWLLFGKVSGDQKNFEIRPLDLNNVPYKGLVLSVEAEIEANDTTYTIKKEHHERIVKKQLRGYEVLCWIDDVPKQVGEYKKFIDELIPEGKFKMLANLNHFPSLHWSEQRKALLELAGEIVFTEGFDDLKKAMKNRSIKDYEKMLKTQKTSLSDEQKEINPRIDEISRGFENRAAGDSDLKLKRTTLESEIESLDGDRDLLLESEKKRQELIDNLNKLKSDKSSREAELKNDTSGVQRYLDEKTEIIKGLANIRQAIEKIKSQVSFKETIISGKKSELERHIIERNVIREEMTKAEAAKDENCPTCGQNIPVTTESEETRKSVLKNIAKNGNEKAALIKEVRELIATKETESDNLIDEAGKLNIRLKEAEDNKTERFAKIKSILDSNETAPPEKDEEWLRIVAEISEAEKNIGEPITESLQKIETIRKAKNDELVAINSTLAQADRIVKDKARIVDLSNIEKLLGQQIADIEKMLQEVDEYKAAESKAVEESVNGKFKFVKFKLFKTNLNGSIEDTCEAMLAGIPYRDLSTGQKMLVGIDIINVLSEYYMLSIPLFVDNYESMTLPIDFEGQIIKLVAVEDVSKMQVIAA